ncbi:hypothetical protein DBV15_05798, partial [Temnothorax longispinosus]
MRNDGPRATTRTHVDTGKVEGNRPEGEGGGSEGRRANDSFFLSRHAVPYVRLRVLHVRACATIGQVDRILREPSWRCSPRSSPRAAKLAEDRTLEDALSGDRIYRVAGRTAVEPVRSVARIKCTNANFGPRDFPQREVSSGQRGKATARTEGGQDFGRDWRDAASLIIGLNVANADFDESSGFECPL